MAHLLSVLSMDVLKSVFEGEAEELERLFPTDFVSKILVPITSLLNDQSERIYSSKDRMAELLYRLTKNNNEIYLDFFRIVESRCTSVLIRSILCVLIDLTPHYVFVAALYEHCPGYLLAYLGLSLIHI